MGEQENKSNPNTFIFGNSIGNYINSGNVYNNQIRDEKIDSVSKMDSDSKSRNSEPLKILFLAANPIDSSRLRLSEELREIKEALKRSKNRDNFILEERWALRPRDLARALLEEKPNIVHFSGHGAGMDGLAIENDEGKTQLLENKALANFFRSFPTIQCVVLNACYSEIQAKAISECVPYVIGMPKAINDKAAREFAIGFYDALGNGASTKDAFDYATNSMMVCYPENKVIPVLVMQLTSK